MASKLHDDANHSFFYVLLQPEVESSSISPSWERSQGGGAQVHLSPPPPSHLAAVAFTSVSHKILQTSLEALIC